MIEKLQEMIQVFIRALVGYRLVSHHYKEEHANSPYELRAGEAHPA